MEKITPLLLFIKGNAVFQSAVRKISRIIITVLNNCKTLRYFKYTAPASCFESYIGDKKTNSIGDCFTGTGSIWQDKMFSNDERTA